MAELVAEAERGSPVGIQLVRAILAIQNILADLCRLGVHLLADIRLRVEIQAGLRHSGSRAVDRAGLHLAHLRLDRQVRDSHVQQGVDEVERLHVGRASSHLALGRRVQGHASEEVQAIQVKGSRQGSLLGDHGFLRTRLEAQLVEIHLVQVFHRVPGQCHAHGEVSPSSLDTRHILRILMVMELLVVSTVEPVASACRQHILVRAQLLQGPAGIILSHIPTPVRERTIETLPDSVLRTIERFRYDLRVELGIHVTRGSRREASHTHQ